jgi:hypothetical protein
MAGKLRWMGANKLLTLLHVGQLGDLFLQHYIPESVLRYNVQSQSATSQ